MQNFDPRSINFPKEIQMCVPVCFDTKLSNLDSYYDNAMQIQQCLISVLQRSVFIAILIKIDITIWEALKKAKSENYAHQFANLQFVPPQPDLSSYCPVDIKGLIGSPKYLSKFASQFPVPPKPQGASDVKTTLETLHLPRTIETTCDPSPAQSAWHAACPKPSQKRFKTV